MNFSDLSLISPILKAAAEAGYAQPSPIQEKAIPPVLAGRDLLGCAQTGTGKTAAFAMPILQLLAEKPARTRKIRALILTPTRELALQIDENFAAYGRYLQLKTCVIFGGVNQNPQVAQLKAGVDILTATPGRLNDLVGQGYLDLSHVEIFVLDEADRMLDMGFVHDVKRVLRCLPAQKQTLLFSATMPREIEELANGLLHKPVKVMVTPPATTVEKIEQSLYFVDKGNKRHLLAHLLRTPQAPPIVSALVFTRTKHGADRVVRELGRDGVRAMAIHGNKSQNARQNALAQFKNGEIRVLVATDIAARGIDINELSHVINYDLPNIPETYVHRIGRTGRAGQPGVAISFCNFDEKEYLADIEKLTHLHIPVVEHSWPMQIFEKAEKAPQGRPGRVARVPAADAKPAKKQKEGKAMETKQAPAPLAQESNSADAQKRRRRRGGKRHNKNGAPAPAPQNAARPQTPALRPQTEKNVARVEKDKDADKSKLAPKSARKPEAVKRQPEVMEDDDSLQVISRKAPAQKYASFEDYIKAHE